MSFKPTLARSLLLRNQPLFYRTALLAARTTKQVKPIPFDIHLDGTNKAFAKEVPPPQSDDIIVAHYFRHHPLWEVRNFDDYPADPYQY